MPANGGGEGNVVQAAIRQSESTSAVATVRDTNQPEASRDPVVNGDAPSKPPTTGTVVLDVEQGGIEVPSFVGRTVRGAVEAAQDAGLELEAVGSGVARQQSPAAGMHVAAGAHVTVQFGR
jgi:cell division protein FtsI (penicillin-binding protein 3)